MVKVVIKYKDTMSRGEWKQTECIVSSVAEAKKIYGLDVDPTVEDYEIVSVEEC